MFLGVELLKLRNVQLVYWYSIVSQDSTFFCCLCLKISRIIAARFSRFKSLPTPFWAFFSIAVFGYSICVWSVYLFFPRTPPVGGDAKPIRYGAGWIKARPPHPKIKYHVRQDEVVEESAGR